MTKYLKYLIFVATMLLLIGCQPVVSKPTPTSVNQSTTYPVASTPTPPNITDTELPYRMDSELTLSQAPAIGEMADLTFKVDVIKLDERTHPKEGLAKSKAWIDFYWTNIHGSYSEAYSSVQIPTDEVIVNGELPWEGSYADGLTLRANIKLPREGIWSIRGRFIGEGWSSGAGAEVEVAAADGTAAIMGTEDFKRGSLAYLDNYIHGKLSRPSVPNQIHPVSLGLDISKAPRVGEEVILSCRILSLIDVPDVSIQWSFYRRTGKIPEAELLTDEDLGWKTDVKKDTPVFFSTTIKFPTEGEWEVFAAGKSGTKFLTGAGHSIKITITSTRSYFGWKEVPVTITPVITEPTTTAIY